MAGKDMIDSEGQKIWPPLWVYGINDHLDIPSKLPAEFEATGFMGADFRQLCSMVSAAVHPAFRQKKIREAVSKSPLPSSGRRPSFTTKVPDLARASLSIGLLMAQEELKPAKEGPTFSARSFLFDRISMGLLSLLLPTVRNIKVLCFSDCHLDCEMLRLLAAGLVSDCSVESLQVEWNSLDLPLPLLDEETPEEEGAHVRVERDEVQSPFDQAASLLEARERKRYRMQSDRLLLNFREWLESRFESLEAAWAILEEAGVDWGAKVEAPDFHLLLSEKLAVNGQQVLEVFEVLDGPDYDADGQVCLEVLKDALESLPDMSPQEDDPLGLSWAGVLDPTCVLESVSFRACAISRFELGPISTALAQCPWQLRALNLWGNRICDNGAELLATALDAYRGLEFLGLGRNRITDLGLQALCRPFRPVALDEAELVTARDRVAKQEAAAKAAAAKPQEGGRQRRSPVALIDEIEERGEESFLRKLSELRCLVLSENPIKSADVLEAIQPHGPRGAELLLRCTAAAAELGERRPELLKEKERYPLLNLGHAKDSSPAEGWVLRLNTFHDPLG